MRSVFFSSLARGAMRGHSSKLPAQRSKTTGRVGGMAARKPTAPGDLKGPGTALWRDVLAQFGLNPAELTLLHQLCRTTDELDAMSTELASSSYTVRGSKQQPRPHPLLAEIRQHRRLVDQLVTALGLPLPTEVLGRRRSASAKQAADSRWRQEKERKGRLASVQEISRKDGS
jgi:hypothetical protein